MSHVNRYTVGHNNKMRRIFEAICGQLDINYFTYHTLSTDGQYSVIVSNPALAEFYTSNKLYQNDAFLKDPENYSEGSVFWSLVKEPSEKELYDLVSKKFDMNNGFGLIQKSRNPRYKYEFFGFTAPNRNNEITNVFVNEIELFKKFCNYFREEASSILKDMHENPVNMATLKGDSFFKIDPMVSQLNEEKRTEIEANFLTLERSAPGSSESGDKKRLLALLSIREKHCLTLYLKGNSATKTAQILRLSPRTVEHYIEGIKYKTGCDRKTDLFKIFG